MIEDTLKKIACQIMALNEETLTALLPKYKARMDNFTPTQEWEESVLIYFLINGLRIKNTQFNDKIKEYMAAQGEGEAARAWPKRPHLRLVDQADETPDGLNGRTGDDDAAAGGTDKHGGGEGQGGPAAED